MDMSGFPKQGLYCYGEASFEENQAMQEPLEKLYKYENQPDMREKVREYISELDEEYDRCMTWVEEHMDGEACQVSAIEMRAKTLMEVKNDLQDRLEEIDMSRVNKTIPNLQKVWDICYKKVATWNI